MSSTWLRVVTMNLSLPLGPLQRLLINPLAQLPPWHSVVNCVWAYSYSCSSCGCLAKWEGVGQETTLPIQIPGEEVHGEAALGAGVPGEVGSEASRRAGAESV